MSDNTGVASTPPSRRSVVKGAAWAVPAVIVAAAAPTVAASQGLLTLNGNACKLPGNSQSTFKGYVFELRANNAIGPNPRDAIICITGISVASTPDLGAFKVVVPGGNPVCTCAATCPVDAANHCFCSKEGLLNQQVLIYTSANVTGNSATSTVTVTYVVYDCNGGAVCPAPGATQTTTATLGGTPPIQGPCMIDGAAANQP